MKLEVILAKTILSKIKLVRIEEIRKMTKSAKFSKCIELIKKASAKYIMSWKTRWEKNETTRKTLLEQVAGT